MLINLGRVLMLGIWAFLLFNLIHPYPKPLTYFIDIALFFMIVMHVLQAILLKSTLAKDQSLSRQHGLRIMIFGVFELLAWQKQTPHTKK